MQLNEFVDVIGHRVFYLGATDSTVLLTPRDGLIRFFPGGRFVSRLHQIVLIGSTILGSWFSAPKVQCRTAQGKLAQRAPPWDKELHVCTLKAGGLSGAATRFQRANQNSIHFPRAALAARACPGPSCTAPSVQTTSFYQLERGAH